MILNGTKQILVYADNTDSLADSDKEICNKGIIFLETAKKVGLEINIDKTKPMVLSRNYINGAK